MSSVLAAAFESEEIIKSDCCDLPFYRHPKLFEYSFKPRSPALEALVRTECGSL